MGRTTIMRASPAKACPWQGTGGRGPPVDGTSGRLMGPGFPHGTSPWAEGSRDSGCARFHALRVGYAGGELTRITARTTRITGHTMLRTVRAPDSISGRQVAGNRTAPSERLNRNPASNRRDIWITDRTNCGQRHRFFLMFTMTIVRVSSMPCSRRGNWGVVE